MQVFLLKILRHITVSSFVQRLGRSGRRGQPVEMLFLFKEEAQDKPREFY